MSNKTFKPSAKLAKAICNEIAEKSNNYEAKMSYRLARWVEIAELMQGKTKTSGDNLRLSPNSAELYKSVRAISNMQFRMLTSMKPFFELQPLDILGHADPSKIIKSEHFVTNQLALSKFSKGLYRTLTQLNLYGSVACHEQYEPLRSSFLGQKRFITSFRPVSLINCAFALDAYDIEESGWCAFNDIQSKQALTKLLSHDPDGKMYNLPGIQAILNQEDYVPRINTWVQQRMAWSGYIGNDFRGGMERSTYYGPLECMRDNEEYAVEIVNRGTIIRMESFEGLRPVRIATVNNLDVEPLGNGLGDQFRPLLGQIDDTRSSLLNTITFAGANMFAKQKGVGDEDMEFAIRNFGIVALENPDMKPLGPDPRTISELAGFLQSQIQEYRQGSGATDTLQALVQGDSATATEVSLSMNEAVRNISVASEIVAPTIIADHIKLVLQNQQKYNTRPFTLVIGKTPIQILPSDLMIDVDVNVLTMTDQNFRPARARNLMAAAQLMIQTPPNAITGYKLDPTDTLVEALKLLDVPNWQNSVKKITEEDILRANVMAQMQNVGQPGTGSELPPGPAGEARVEAGKPGRKEQRTMNKNMAMPMAEGATMPTPGGPVLTAPGSQAASLQAIRNASVAGDQAILKAK